MRDQGARETRRPASPGLQRARSVASPFLGGLAEKYLATWSRKPPGFAILVATPPSFLLSSSCRWHLSPRALSLVFSCEGAAFLIAILLRFIFDFLGSAFLTRSRRCHLFFFGRYDVAP